MTAAPDPLLGSTIAGIRLDEKLGTGGMGAVYLGVQTAMSRRVAVKILSEHLSSNAEYISRFRREAITAGKLEHPNIVSVYDIGHEEGRYFIVMEYVEGQSLQRILDVVGALSPREAARFLIGILRGLHHAHTAGVVHRDVKPGNIIVTRENEPKILDFGLAIAIDPRDKLTGTGSVLGTPLYLSPEQASGKKAEPRSDLYSAGVMFYALLTGRVPFSGQDPLAVLNMHLHEKPVSPINLNPRLPQALNDIALKMLAKRPEDRYATAELAARDLQQFLDGKPLSLAPRPASPRVVRKRAAPVGLIVGTVLAVIFIIVLIQVAKPSKEDPPPPPPTAKGPPKPDPDLENLRLDADAVVATAVRDGEKDHAVFPFSFNQLASLAGRHPLRKEAAAIVETARKRLADHVEGLAKDQEAALRPRLQAARLDSDFYLMRDLYREFPRNFLDITDTGRTIKQEIRENEERIQTRMAADFESIPRLLDADEFDLARARLKRLGDVVPPEKRNQVSELMEQTDKAETERRRQLIPKLLAEAASLESLVASLLERRQSDEAWNGILGFVESHPPTKLSAALVRIASIPQPSLRGVVPSTVTEEEIESLLGRFEAEPESKDEDLPSQRVRWLCEDVLRREWMLRRAARGIQRLAGVEVVLRSFGGAKGKIVSGAIESRPLVVDQLDPRDQVFFGAASFVGAEKPVETVFKTPEFKRFAPAAAALHRYAPTPDRYSEALRWLEQAKTLGHRVGPLRLAALEEAAKLERDQIARDLLGKALDHGNAGRFDKAHEELDRGLKEHEDKSYWPLLESVGRDLRAKFLLAEAEDDAKGQRWTKALAALRRLRSVHPAYQAERATPLFHKALYTSGAWATWPLSAPNAASKTWTWEGKAGGTPPSARFEGGHIVLFDVRGFRPLYLERPRTAGATGIRAKVKVNQAQQGYEAGFQFDVKDPAGDLRRFLLRGPSRIEVGSRKADRWAVDGDEELTAAPALREWHEIAIVTDGTETVFYFGTPGSPSGVLTLPGGWDSKAGFGLWANVDTAFSDIQVRDAKP